MSNKIKTIIAVGGTGGHVFPGCNLAKHLEEKNYEVKMITDKRGEKFLRHYPNFDISTLPSSPIITRNIFSLFFSLIFILYSIASSTLYLILNRPKIIFGMGGYASFPICVASWILRIKFVIYENNLIIGKANKYLMPITDKILVAVKDVEGVPEKYCKKIIEVGNIISKEIINFSSGEVKNSQKKINLLILGGSQAAKIFAEKLPKIFKECAKKDISIKVYQHCLPSQNKYLKAFYEKHNLEFETFNFTKNLTEYFSKVNLAITRSGSSILAELTNANIPFISVPLPSSADNHQHKNATYYQKKKLSFLIEEKDLESKLLYLFEDIYNNSSVLDIIKKNLRQYSDKKVYNNIDEVLKKIINEKN